MTEGDWTRVEKLFHRASELDTGARTRFLDEHLAGEDTLRARVERLVAASDDDSPITDAIDSAARGAIAAEAESFVGRRVGAYRIVREIGRGGMGTVYAAERDDGSYDAQVAIKIIRGALAGPDLFRRFVAERRILAGLVHPNIARLLDAGRTGDGVPYMVMEYVEGLPIDEYCDRRSLGIDGRLHLFEQVCAAVQFAHRNFVVHRDLKPANILVTPEGVPKLLDFGIAKLLDAQGVVETLMLTATGIEIMTPAYASPEQIRGLPVTTATDVYGLGLIFYKLLTGRAAHQFSNRTALEVDRVVCRDLPPQPEALYRTRGGTPVGEDATSATVRARARDATPRELQRTLRGDLGTIVMKTLRKEPERRYGSVEMLVEDLRRYRRGLPVQARTDSVGYRVRRFVGRHPVGVVTGVAFGLLVLAFTTVLAIQNVRIATERDTAELRRQVSAEVSDFLVSVFGTADPGPDGAVSPALALEEGSARIRALENRPAVQAGVTAAVGQLYHELGLFDDGLRTLTRAYERRVQLFGPDAGEVAASLQTLGALRFDMGDTPLASEHFREALRIRSELLEPGHPERIASMLGLARALTEEGRLAEADSLYRGALHVSEDPGLTFEKASIHFDFAESLFRSGRRGEAGAFADSALEIRSGRLAPGHPELEASRVQVERFRAADRSHPWLDVADVAPHQAPIGTPFGAVAGDFDGDGRLDLAWNHLGEVNEVYVGFGGPDGTFARGEAKRIPVDSPPYAWPQWELKTGDFDGDGRDDLLWNARSTDNHLVVGLSRGDRSFAFSGVFTIADRIGSAPYWEPTRLLVGDVTGDGADDLVWWTPRQMLVWLAESNRDGTFELHNWLGSPLAPGAFRLDIGSEVDAAQLMRRGGSGLDLVWSQWEAYNATGLSRWDPTRVEWTEPRVQAHASGYPNIYEQVGAWHYYRMLTADLDGDGDDDLIWVDPATPHEPADTQNRVYVGIREGSRFELELPAHDSLPGGDPGPFSVATGDLNGDGRADLVWNDRSASGENRIYVSIAVPSGRSGPFFRPVGPSLLHPDREDWSRAEYFVGDVDGDGRDDIVWNRTGALNRVYVALSRLNGAGGP